MGIWYVTREDVKSALDFKETARNDGQVDRAIEASSRAVEDLCHRRFYPELDTRSFDWPNAQRAAPWRLWLDQNELVSVTSVTSGGHSIPVDQVLLEPDTGPPYTRLELNQGSTAAFAAGSTHQRAITVTGVFAGCAVNDVPAGELAASVDGTQTTITLTDSSQAGGGDILLVGTERMSVTTRRMSSTGTTLATPLSSLNANVSVTVTDGSGFAAGETILLDAERMLVVDVAGNTLVVKRAWDGSVLAEHTGSTVYALRTLTVVRGILGTTSAAHSSGAAVQKYQAPGLVRSLTLAEALNIILQETSGYARTTGSGDNEREVAGRSLRGLRDQVYASHGRKARIRGV